MANKKALNEMMLKRLNEKKEKKDPIILPIEEAQEKKVADLADQPENKNGESISEILDHCAERAEDFYDEIEARVKRGIQSVGATDTNAFNPVFLGPTGVGKTSIIKTWARDRGYDVITLNMMGDALDFLGVKTITRGADVQIDDNGNTEKRDRVTTVATKAFDVFLTGKKKILFLDEINKTNPRILQSLYDLISFHIIQNGDDVMFLPKLLFTVGAMNPSGYGNRDALDPALKARMRVVKVDYNTEEWKQYMKKALEQNTFICKQELLDLKKAKTPDDDSSFVKWARRYEQAVGREDILNAIKNISWTADEEINNNVEDDEAAVLTPRTLSNAFENCNGRKIDFLKYVKAYCGTKAWEDMVDELKIYKDKDHKANEIWGKNYDPEEPKPEVKPEDSINVDNVKGQHKGSFDNMAAISSGKSPYDNK